MIAPLSLRRARPRFGPAGGFLVRLLGLLETWHARHQERRALVQLDDRMLKDIGLSRADVAQESGKRFWQE
jgi:uncharacterized protein YjiS (DUF1127 family)